MTIEVRGLRAIVELEDDERWEFARVDGEWKLDDDGYGGGEAPGDGDLS